ncbi:MAG: ribosome-binding factor A [Verrucomicrobiota bacterium JB022]|nr:ribosome-binding factor A [Verrucomicrobiota bacterium JB022]
MSQRQIRVNELLKREISMILHTRFRSRATTITILDVDVAPNLRTAKVFYSVFGDESAQRDADHFFTRNHVEIRHYMGKTITLKYLPHLDFVYDPSQERGAEINALLDEMGYSGELKYEPEPEPADEDEDVGDEEGDDDFDSDEAYEDADDDASDYDDEEDDDDFDDDEDYEDEEDDYEDEEDDDEDEERRS